MNGDVPAPCDPRQFYDMSKPAIVQPLHEVTTVAYPAPHAAVAIDGPTEGVRIVIRRPPPPERSGPWALPGLEGAVETLRLLLDFPSATDKNFCDLLFLLAHWQAMIEAKASFAARRRFFARSGWEEEVYS